MLPPLGWLRRLGLTSALTMAFGMAAYLVYQLGHREHWWTPTFRVKVHFAEVHDVHVGTLVRVRGVEAGRVTALNDAAESGPPGVELTLELDTRYQDRLYADAVVSLQSQGLLGGKIVSIHPGTAAAGPRTGDRLTTRDEPDIARAAARLEAVAAEAEQLLAQARRGQGTLGKLVQDDSLFQEFKGLAQEGREEFRKVSQFVEEGRATMTSVRQGTEALGKLPVVRSYVEDPASILIRPRDRRQRWAYHLQDLFEPGTAILNDSGRHHLTAIASYLQNPEARPVRELVIAVSYDPASRLYDPATALTLTRQQALVVKEFFESLGVHRTGFWSRRTITPLGLGLNIPPSVEKETLPEQALQILAFTPAGS